MQALVREVALLEGIQINPGWRALLRRVREQRDTFLLSVAKRLMAGEEIASMEIDYYRGYYAGAEAVLSRPEKAMENLERAARIAYAKAQEELMAAQQEESPYA